MTRRNYDNDDMAEIVGMLLDQGYSLEHVKNLAADLPGEFEATEQARNEAAWEAFQNRQLGDAAYRRQMIDAGRGGLLG